MKKKITVLALCAMLFALCVTAEAQQPKKVPRIGFLEGRRAEDAPRGEAFLKGLRELGYHTGQNIVIERRVGGNSEDSIAKAAMDLAHLGVDCIITAGTASTLAAKQATSTIPIVMVNVGDAVERGFVVSLARPGGNITGFTTSSPDLADKRLELLKETFPKISRVAILWNPTRLGTNAHIKETEVAARALNIQLHALEVRRADDIDGAFRAAGKSRAQALIVAGAGVGNERAKLLDLAGKNRLPVMYSDPRFVVAGGLISYAADISEPFHRAAAYVDRILKGTKPSDLPVQRPMKFELIVNLKAAKQIGVTIPQSVLYRADKVIR